MLAGFSRMRCHIGFPDCWMEIYKSCNITAYDPKWWPWRKKTIVTKFKLVVDISRARLLGIFQLIFLQQINTKGIWRVSRLDYFYKGTIHHALAEASRDTCFGAELS